MLKYLALLVILSAVTMGAANATGGAGPGNGGPGMGGGGPGNGGDGGDGGGLSPAAAAAIAGQSGGQAVGATCQGYGCGFVFGQSGGSRPKGNIGFPLLRLLSFGAIE